MAAYWHLQCVGCDKLHQNVQCSMFDIPACPDCGGEQRLAPSASIRKSGIFPFTCSHVDGTPMVINDIAHLRRVEAQYGVAFSAFSKSNINDLDPMKDVPVYRGELGGVRRH